MNKDKAFWVDSEPIEMSRKKIKQPEVIKDTVEETVVIQHLGKTKMITTYKRKEFTTEVSHAFFTEGSGEE